jgi:hypothetical protein
MLPVSLDFLFLLAPSVSKGQAKIENPEKLAT